jgi:hypothetical protein
MKKTTNVLTIALMFISFGSFAQISATATSTATIVSPLGITQVVDMNFGNVAKSAAPGTVVLAPDGSRTVTGGATLSTAFAGTVTAASFNVTGEGTYTYAITLPSADVTLTNTTGVGAETMILNTFTSAPNGTGTLTAGAQTLTVGATLNVGANQVAGTYVSTPFTVSVVYN